MEWLLKLCGVMVMAAVGSWLLKLWYDTYVQGQLYETASPLVAILGGFFPIVVVALWLYGCKVLVNADFKN